MENLYNVFNILTGEQVLDQVPSSKVSETIGIKQKSVATYAWSGIKYKSIYAIEQIPQEPEMDKKDANLGTFRVEWDEVTTYLRSKIIWCKKGTKGARKIYLSHK
jgi:hypothetical protein